MSSASLLKLTGIGKSALAFRLPPKMETSSVDDEAERLQCRFKVSFPKDSLPSFANHHSVEEIEHIERRAAPKEKRNSGENEKEATFTTPNVSIFQYFRLELSRSYLLENDEARYSERREKVYTFMKMPRDVEKFMSYGFLQCLDAFLYVFTFLPLRLVVAIWVLLTSPFRNLFGRVRGRPKQVLQPAEICDILKGITVIVCTVLMLHIDTSMMYHLIKSQSVIKLYIFFNMLEVGDRLLSAFGQDVLDTLFWTATEPRERKREHFGVIPHLTLAIFYVFMHTVLVLFQAVTLNVAINSSNKALLTIMMSNNFVELKGSVFKKFEKNNLFQMSCSDVRERFHYCILLLTVIIQTMKEYAWKEDRFWILLPDCLMVLFSEILVDWVKHAFITRFNELPTEVYQQYTVSLAYDLACSKQKNAFSDHSDLVSRRMGFIPLPLGVLILRVASQSIRVKDIFGIFLVFVGYLCLMTLKLLNSIVILGRAYDLIDQHKKTSVAPKNPKQKVPRCSSHPPSRKPSTEKMPPPQGSKSVTHSRTPSFTGSLTDMSSSVEMQQPLGPKPIFCNSSVSLNSLGMNDGPLESRESFVGLRAMAQQLTSSASELRRTEDSRPNS